MFFRGKPGHLSLADLVQLVHKFWDDHSSDPTSPFYVKVLPSLKLTASSPLKMDGYWVNGLFSGAFAVSFREGTCCEMLKGPLILCSKLGERWFKPQFRGQTKKPRSHQLVSNLVTFKRTLTYPCFAYPMNPQTHPQMIQEFRNINCRARGSGVSRGMLENS